MYSFSSLEPVYCSMSSSNCCFLTCQQVSQEAGQVVWYSHLFQSFPEFIVIHTVEAFGIVNKAEIDVFLELSCFFDDPGDVGNLISGSSAFSKTSLNIWKFIVHILLKPGLENFEHYFTSVWDEYNCAVVWDRYSLIPNLFYLVVYTLVLFSFHNVFRFQKQYFFACCSKWSNKMQRGIKAKLVIAPSPLLPSLLCNLGQWLFESFLKLSFSLKIFNCTFIIRVLLVFTEIGNFMHIFLLLLLFFFTLWTFNNQEIYTYQLLIFSSFFIYKYIFAFVLKWYLNLKSGVQSSIW